MQIVNEFYTRWFKDQEKASSFLARCYEDHNDNYIPRRLANQLARVINFSDFCMDNKSGNSSVQIFFWMSLIESIEYIYFPDKDSEKVDKLSVILNFFRNYVLDNDKSILLKNLRRSIIDERFFNEEFNIDIVARILYSIRNHFVHELEFHTSIFSESNNDNWIETIKLREFKKDEKDERHYEMSITHQQLREIIIRSYINLIEEELAKKTVKGV